MKLAIALIMAGLLPAQDANQKEMRIFQLKYVDPKTLVQTMGPLHMFIHTNADLRTLTVHAEPAIVRQVEDAVKRFDVPPPPQKNIEVTVYVLGGAGDGAASLPPELEAVAKQLRAAFGPRSFRLVDTQVIRTRDGGGGDVSGTVGSGVPPTIATYRFGRARTSVDEKGRTIRLDGLRLGFRVPIVGAQGAVQYHDMGIGTDIDVREGQKAVVGTTVRENSEKASLFVVMAKVVE